MEQRFDEPFPRADIRLDGRRLVRSAVTNDWGLLLRWEIRKNGQVVATPAARADTSYEHADTSPGQYEIVLQMFRYLNYRKRPDGEYTDSRFIDISNRVSYTI